MYDYRNVSLSTTLNDRNACFILYTSCGYYRVDLCQTILNADAEHVRGSLENFCLLCAVNNAEDRAQAKPCLPFCLFAGQISVNLAILHHDQLHSLLALIPFAIHF